MNNVFDKLTLKDKEIARLNNMIKLKEEKYNTEDNIATLITNNLNNQELNDDDNDL